MCCLSEPGYHEFMEALTHKHGTIARLWIGPHLVVVLAESKYVEVSKFALATRTKKKHSVTLNYGVTLRLNCVLEFNCCPGLWGYKWSPIFCSLDDGVAYEEFKLRILHRCRR